MGQVTDTGYEATDLTTFLAALHTSWSAAAGQDLNFDDDTPQAQITGTEALTLAEADEVIADLASSLDIYQAKGQQLDDLCSILSIPRNAAVKANVNAELTGVPLAVIPAGAKAKLSTGEKFTLRDPVSLNTLGNGVGFFQADDDGTIDIPIGALNSIVTPEPGWETVDNSEQGASGSPTEADYAYRRRYFKTLAKNALSSLEAILANVFTLEGVTDVTGVENDTSVPVDIQGVTVAAHSVAVSVVGGADSDVAEAIRFSKTLGCGTVGDNTVSVPVYLPGTTQIIQNIDIKFYRVVTVPLKISMTLDVGPGFPPDGEENIKRDLVAYINGSDEFVLEEFELDGLQIGEDVYKSRLYTPINRTPGHVINQLNLLQEVYDAYAAGTTYGTGDRVTDVGVDYYSLQTGNVGNTPASSPTFWAPLVSEDFITVDLNQKASLTTDDITINTL